MFSIQNRVYYWQIPEFQKAIRKQRFFPISYTDVPLETDNIYASITKNGKIVAFGMIRGWDEGWPDKILGLIVHPEHQRKGYGSLMLNFLECLARKRNVKILRLHVHPDNIAALNLYKNHGYYFYSKREDGEWIMLKVL